MTHFLLGSVYPDRVEPLIKTVEFREIEPLFCCFSLSLRCGLRREADGWKDWISDMESPEKPLIKPSPETAPYENSGGVIPSFPALRIYAENEAGLYLPAALALIVLNYCAPQEF